jgi:ubiquinone/menaquinone biosynthesis C-methylase UbiE
VNKLRILDAGCGTGNYLKEISGEVGECVGVEFNEGMLKQARQKLD